MSDTAHHVHQANIYIQPCYFLLAIVASALNIRVLCSRTLCKSPCTHYFLAHAIFSFTYIALLCPTQFFQAFSLVWTHNDTSCGIHFYVLFLIPFQASLMLVLASFDRYCSSSKSCRFHSRSTIRTARVTIVASTVLSAVYMAPMLVIYKWNPALNRCQARTTILIKIYVTSQVVLYHLLAPVLTILFGALTIGNIRRQSRRAVPLRGSIRGRRTEGQLARMLILQVTVHLILVLPYGVVYLVNTYDPSTQTPTIIAVRLAFVTWQQCDYFLSLFLYIFSGSVYRQQLIRIGKSFQGHRSSSQTLTRRRKDRPHKALRVTTSIPSTNGTTDLTM